MRTTAKCELMSLSGVILRPLKRIARIHVWRLPAVRRPNRFGLTSSKSRSAVDAQTKSDSVGSCSVKNLNTRVTLQWARSHCSGQKRKKIAVTCSYCHLPKESSKSKFSHSIPFSFD